MITSVNGNNSGNVQIDKVNNSGTTSNFNGINSSVAEEVDLSDLLTLDQAEEITDNKVKEFEEKKEELEGKLDQLKQDQDNINSQIKDTEAELNDLLAGAENINNNNQSSENQVVLEKLGDDYDNSINIESSGANGGETIVEGLKDGTDGLSNQISSQSIGSTIGVTRLDQ